MNDASEVGEVLLAAHVVIEVGKVAPAGTLASGLRALGKWAALAKEAVVRERKHDFVRCWVRPRLDVKFAVNELTKHRRFSHAAFLHPRILDLDPGLVK